MNVILVQIIKNRTCFLDYFGKRIVRRHNAVSFLKTFGKIRRAAESCFKRNIRNIPRVFV
jgi:hypothetical protein